MVTKLRLRVSCDTDVIAHGLARASAAARCSETGLSFGSWPDSREGMQEIVITNPETDLDTCYRARIHLK